MIFPILVNPVFPKHAPLSTHTFIRVYFGRSENFHSVHPSGAYTHFFFSKTFVSRSVNPFFFQRKARSYFFPKTCRLLVNQSIFNYYYYYYYYYFPFLTKLISTITYIFFSFLKSRANEGTHGLPTWNHKVNGKSAMISRNEKQWQNNWEP